MTSKTVKVPNISCGHCVATIQREVGGLMGVSEVEGDEATRKVTITWDPEAIEWKAIEDVMEEIDYPPQPAG